MKKAKEGKEIEWWGGINFGGVAVRKGLSVAAWVLNGEVSTEELGGGTWSRGPETEGTHMLQQPECDARGGTGSMGQNMPGFAGCYGERASCRKVTWTDSYLKTSLCSEEEGSRRAVGGSAGFQAGDDGSWDKQGEGEVARSGLILDLFWR